MTQGHLTSLGGTIISLWDMYGMGHMATLGHVATLEANHMVTPEPPGVTGGTLYWSMRDIFSGSYGDTGGISLVQSYDDTGHMATLGGISSHDTGTPHVTWRYPL